jgi:hypothetical protein
MLHRWRVIRLAIAGGTGLLMVTTVVILVLRKSRGFGTEFFLTLLIALLPSAIFALAGPEQRRVLVWGTVHVVLVVTLALLYLIGTGPLGFIYAFLLYFAALAASIVAAVDR